MTDRLVAPLQFQGHKPTRAGLLSLRRFGGIDDVWRDTSLDLSRLGKGADYRDRG
jgi:hypothetical protein